MTSPPQDLDAPAVGGSASREWLVARTMSQLPALLWIQLDQDGRILAWNAAAASLFDPKAQLVLGRGSDVSLEQVLEDEASRLSLAGAIANLRPGVPQPLVLGVVRRGTTLEVQFELVRTPRALGGRGLSLVGRLGRDGADSRLGMAIADQALDRLHHTALGARALLGLPRADPDRRVRDAGRLPIDSLRPEQRAPFVTDLAAGIMASVDVFIAPLGDEGRTLRIDAALLPGDDSHPTVNVITIRDSSSLRHEVLDLELRERRLRRVVEATSAVTGRGFLRSLVRSLSFALGVRVAYVAERLPREPDRMRMLCLWSGTEFTAGYTYAARGTLDELVIADGPVRYSGGLAARVAADSWVNTEGLESYFGVPIPDSAEQVVGVLGVMATGPLDESLPVADILGVFAARVGVELERLRAEEALRASEERWRSLLENAPDVILSVDREGQVRFHNLAAFDAAPDLGEQLEWRVDERDREPFSQTLRRVLTRREPESIEVRARWIGEQHRWFSLRVGPLHRGDGGAIIVATDIEDAKREELVTRHRSALEHKLATLSTRFLALDLEHTEEEVQRALEELAQVIGADRAVLYRFDEERRGLLSTQTWAAAGVTPLPPVIADPQPLGWLVEYADQGREAVLGVGGICSISAQERSELVGIGAARFACVPLRCRGVGQGLVGFCAGETAVPWDGELLALVRIAGDLLASTLDRAREIARRRVLERELRHSQKLEAIGTLAGGIAHDFNNLLTGVLGHATLIGRAAGTDGRILASAQAIEAAAQRAADLTRKIQRFGRRRESGFTEVDLHATVVEVTELLHRSLPESVELQVDLVAPSATISGDASLLSQVILNLAVNARDAMPAGGKLRIATRSTQVGAAEAASMPEVSPGRFVALDVSDEGHGMAPELLDRIFDPFFTTKERAEGRGMGLATAYGIVRKHGGAIRVESEQDAGSTFTLLLPLADAGRAGDGDDGSIDARWIALAGVDDDLPGGESDEQPAAIPPLVPATAADTAKAGDDVRKTILIVDDDDIVLITAAALLESVGFATLSVSSGEAAVELYAERGTEVDLVLLDMMMPGMDGRECLAMLRQMDPGVRVVLSSGWGFEGIVDELRRAGIIGFANKPYGLGELEQIVTDCLEGSTPLLAEGVQPSADGVL
ncbi:ATP-binding protein [Engelhardtia mirabilis]|uniref:histidine kinase n=1 Tax=Engelhardtia mirabilis TaxID=2528011 RepID=A0A518BJV6_9BACT|nr:Blue-light-activated protein [Planctomycetes bacterium Pla133]QDV01585.1 Blue-light-activated protein [Planctomycetes bacterium Pla86]